MPPTTLLPYSKISIGEPDANAEYFSALRTHHTPVFLDNFFTLPHLPLEEIERGQKYLIYGQKGTGKTAILRYLQKKNTNTARSEFLIFKKSFLEETDIQDVSHISLMLDEDELKHFKHYYHAMKRMLVLLLLNKQFMRDVQDDEMPELEESDKSLVKRIANSHAGNVIRLGFDSIATIFKSAGLNIEKVTSNKALVDSARLLKRNNDDLLNFLCRASKTHPSRIRLYLDEIHFAYRTEESLQQDAILVRDTILAIQALNERFATEGLDIIVYAAVRAEYLEHPIIATADINHTIESVGISVSWSTFPLTRNHPLFDLIIMRFAASIGPHFKPAAFFNQYMKNIDPIVLLERTWSKPRDIVRFFKCAKSLYPTKYLLTPGDANAVWRDYAHESWREMKSAAAAFLPPDAIAKFESILAGLAPGIYDSSVKLNIKTFSEAMKPVYQLAKHKHVNFYDFDHFIRLLYILGIFLTRQHTAIGDEIYQSYHRGNRNFHANGEVMIHPTVLRAFG